MMRAYKLTAAISFTLLSAAGSFSLPAAAQEKVLRVGAQATDIATLDPHRTSSTHEKGPISWIFGGLVRFPPGSADPAKIEGDLAESWTESGSDYASVAMRFSFINTMIERASNRVVSGDPNQVQEATEIWTFRLASGGTWMLSAIQHTH